MANSQTDTHRHILTHTHTHTHSHTRGSDVCACVHVRVCRTHVILVAANTNQWNNPLTGLERELRITFNTSINSARNRCPQPPPGSLCMSVCVLLAASQDDGEVRAALGTSSQWRGLRPRDALAAISQGSPVDASPAGLQVTPGKRIDRPIYFHSFLMTTPA